MKETWTQCAGRARQLAAAGGPGAPMLESYADILTFQQQASDVFSTGLGRSASGSLEQDLPVVRTQVPRLVRAILAKGPPSLAAEAARLLEGGGSTAIDDALLGYWRAPSDQDFFAKATLQPYAAWLAECGIEPAGRQLPRAANRCPFCHGSPQLSLLGGGDGAVAGRHLLCATCLTIWPFSRVVCLYCGEDDERKTGYFHTPLFDHLRVDACESCKRYLKTVDLTKTALAVPLVDEVAGAPLDLWARDRGYEKIELNLLGL
jgi:formate dehydrogenase accessory protein FdhE